MSGIKIIIQKELTRVFKDKKLVFSLFILPAVIIIGMYTLLGSMMTSLNDDVTQHISLVEIQNMPEGLDEIIKDSGFSMSSQLTYLAAQDDIMKSKDKILNGEMDLLVVFDENFLEHAAAYKKVGDPVPSVMLYYNTSGNYSSTAKEKFDEMVLSELRNNVLTERLGNIELLTAFDMKTQIIVDEEKQGGEQLAMMLPYFITFLLFAGAMGLGVDAITGEKERGTMASMLLTPLKRQDIVVGKLVSLTILSGLSSLVYATAMIIAMPMMTGGFGGEQISSNVNFSIQQILQLVVIMLVMVYLYVAIVSLLAVLAKTAKEATTYVTPIYIVVLVAGLLTMFQGGMEKPLYQYMIPVYGNALSIQNLMTNELTMQQFLFSIGGTGLAAIIVTIFITKAFNSEKIMFNA